MYQIKHKISQSTRDTTRSKTTNVMAWTHEIRVEFSCIIMGMNAIVTWTCTLLEIIKNATALNHN